MDRKEFFARVGFGAAALLIPGCITGLATSCSNDDGKVTPAPTGVDFKLDVATGALATNGGSQLINGIVIARANDGTFIAVSAACTHAGTNVDYVASNNSFHCSNHGQNYSNIGAVTTGGKTSTGLTQYKTTLTGTSLRVYS
jgi:cytochrome b6-f complex iron-sulfur subunit